MTIPRYIALCGWPKSGKDEVAKSLARYFATITIDDGHCLRQAAPTLFGCDAIDPYTQEGKSRVYETIAGPKEVRWMLGELGNALENHFGEGFMPYTAMEHAERRVVPGQSRPRFVFPSVRKSQGQFYKAKGALVVEVHRPGVEDSSHAFDAWDKSYVDMTIINDSTLEALDRAVHEAFWDIEHFSERPKVVYANEYA